MKVAIIHARGGSKRIPKKNIKPFCGKPMIFYPIKAALKSGLFDKVVVSTDSQEIAEVAKQFGAEVPYMRPAELADDHSTTARVLAYDIKQFEELTLACCLYATAPFLTAESLKRGFDVMQSDESIETAFSVATYDFPIFRALKVNERGCLEMYWPEHRNTRSQDLPDAYHDAGQFYWVNPKTFAQNPMLYTSNSRPIVLPRYLVQDIDTIEDWERAEYMYKALMFSGVLQD